MAQNDKDKPKGSIVAMVGQTATMNSAYSGLLFGLLGAIVLVYLLIVINFQSWSDPFIIITALPGALAGIVWMLFATHTTLSVPALTGAIMCMGVATANSVLVVSFARERLNELGDATQPALESGSVRRRTRAPRHRCRRLRHGFPRGTKLEPARFDRSAGRAYRGDRGTYPCAESGGPGPARAPGSLHQCTHLRARPGLPEKLEVRYRRQGEGRRPARRNRYARSRPAAPAGARRPRRRPGQCQARKNHRAALAVAGRHRRR